MPDLPLSDARSRPLSGFTPARPNAPAGSYRTADGWTATRDRFRGRARDGCGSGPESPTPRRPARPPFVAPAPAGGGETDRVPAEFAVKA